MLKTSLPCVLALAASIAVGVAAGSQAQNNTIPNFSFTDSGCLGQGADAQIQSGCPGRPPCILLPIALLAGRHAGAIAVPGRAHLLRADAERGLDHLAA